MAQIKVGESRLTMSIREMEVEPFTLTIKGLDLSDETMKLVGNVCHKHKHLYKEGYPCGRKTRMKTKKKYVRQKNPGMCFTYLVTKHNGVLVIHVLVSSLKELLERYTLDEILFQVQQYLQDVADELLKVIGEDDIFSQ